VNTDTSHTSVRRRTLILIRVNEKAEDFYEDALELGTIAALAFQKELSSNKRNKHRAQMTGLENIAETTLKFTDVLDYIKKHIARLDLWRVPYVGKEGGKSKPLGESLKSYIEGPLKTEADRICDDLHIGDTLVEDKRDRQLVYLQLIRQFVRQIVVQFEYKA